MQALYVALLQAQFSSPRVSGAVYIDYIVKL